MSKKQHQSIACRGRQEQCAVAGCSRRFTRKFRRTRVGVISPACCMLFLVALLVASSAWAQEPASPYYHPAHVLVRFKPAIGGIARQEAHARARSLRVLVDYHIVDGLQLVEVPHRKVRTAVNAYKNNPNVLYAEPDYIVRATAIPNEWTSGEFAKQWGLRNRGQTVNGDPGRPDADIDANQAWDFWQGDPDFRIAVIDTGVDYNHPDLADNIWINPCEDLNGNGQVDPTDFNGMDDPCPGEQQGNGYVDDIAGYNFLYPTVQYPTPDPMDDDGHGTHIAGTIAAVGDNAIGVVGVNWRAKIVALKVLGADGTGLISDIVKAIQYCKDNNIKLSNNSYSLCSQPFQNPSDFPKSMENGIRQLHKAVGHVFVASAGNLDENGGCTRLDSDQFPFYPASFDLENIIAVAATDNDDALWHESVFGATSVDLGAPGVNVYSTVIEPQTGAHTYGFKTGTSMAAPHVTGVVALLWSQVEDEPAWDWERVRDRVLSTVRPVPSLQGKTVTGGVVNARAAILDCNNNTIDDETDIASGTSLDCFGYESDCCVAHDFAGCEDPEIQDCVCIENEWNDVCCCMGCTWNRFCVGEAVICEASCGLSPDSLPDECQDSADCQGNGIPDACDLTCGVDGGPCDPDVYSQCGMKQDCNANCTPDDCDMDPSDPDGDGLVSLDCNRNNIPDECDLADGTSCDADSNGIPDECVPCCVNGECLNRVALFCEADPPDGLGGDAHMGSVAATCNDCTCSDTACCRADGTCTVLAGCECVVQGDKSLTAFNAPCSFCDTNSGTGVCCTIGGCVNMNIGGDPITADNCNDAPPINGIFGTFVDGQTECFQINPNPCAPITVDCADASIVSVQPASETHDARRPYPQSDDSLSAREGIGSMNIYPGGPEPVEITLGVECARHFACWKLCETGIEQVEVNSEELDPNRIISITETSMGVYEIFPERPISGGHWTTITYLGDSTGGSVVSYASLPADSNADGVSNGLDVTDFLDCCISDLCIPPHGLYSCDIDHSGATGLPDVLELIDLLNGLGLFIPWDGVMLSDNTCLSGGQSSASAQQELATSFGGALSTAAVNQHFADRFVAYLSTGTLVDAVTEPDFRLILEALTRWAVDHFSREERETLASRLQDPSLSFENPTAAQMIPGIVAALLK